VSIEIRSYPLGDQWGLYVNGTEFVLDTSMEVQQMTSKIQLAQAILFQTQLHARPMEENGDVWQEYWDSGVTFSDEDLEPLGVTADQIAACITLLENAGKFYAGDTPAVALYRMTINAVKRAPTS